MATPPTTGVARPCLFLELGLSSRPIFCARGIKTYKAPTQKATANKPVDSKDIKI